MTGARDLAYHRERVTVQHMDVERHSFQKKLSGVIKEAQQRLREVKQARANACSIQTELDDLQSRFHDIGGDNVYTAHTQHVGSTLEGRLLTPVLAEARK